MTPETELRASQLKNKLLASLEDERVRNCIETESSLDSGSPTLPSQSTFYSEINPNHYNSSTFPSLMSVIGVTSSRAQRKKKAKQQKQKDPEEENKVTKHRDLESLSFGEQMRRRNEVQWLRIEAVAKDNMEKYDKRARDIYKKVRSQRDEINKRSERLLESLSRMEQEKREEHVYQSIHGRMWRHHRSLQRRAYNLEPMRAKSRVSVPRSSIAGSDLSV